jgi:8-oxo-dGTP diphosphatase
MARAPILAAGGIVLRGGSRPRVAIVQRRRDNCWVLPKGKLKARESALAAAKREVVEETGRRVSVHEFLGAMTYKAGGAPKIVQFWRMRAIGKPTGQTTREVKAVQWLPLEKAVERLTLSRERVFLAHVGPIALKAVERSIRRSKPAPRPARGTRVEVPLPSTRRHQVEVAHPFARKNVVEKAWMWFQRKTLNRDSRGATLSTPRQRSA